MVPNKEFQIDRSLLGLPAVTFCQIKSSSMKDLTQTVVLPQTTIMEKENCESDQVALKRNPSMPIILPKQQIAAKRTVIALNNDRSGYQLQNQPQKNKQKQLTQPRHLHGSSEK